MLTESIDLLGLRAVDKVTGFSGVITSVSFDLFGCVQVVLKPALDKDGKMPDGQWFDVNRLSFESDERVMPVPSFGGKTVTPATFSNGPAEKPMPH